MDVFDTFLATKLIVSYYNCQLFLDQKLILCDLASAYFDLIILQVCTFPYIIFSHLLFLLFKIDHSITWILYFEHLPTFRGWTRIVIQCLNLAFSSAYFSIIPRRTSLSRRCYNPFSKKNHKRDPCSLRTISATLQKKYPSIPIDAKLCVNCRKEISQLALLSSLYSHTDPTIEDASVINDSSPPILENDILMEDGRYLRRSFDIQVSKI